MQSFGYAGENWTTPTFCSTTDGDHIGEVLTRFPNVENLLRLLPREVDPYFGHRLHNKRVDFAGFESCALRVEKLAANVVHPRLSHLTAGAVMNANKENFFLCHFSFSHLCRSRTSGAVHSNSFEVVAIFRDRL